MSPAHSCCVDLSIAFFCLPHVLFKLRSCACLFGRLGPGGNEPNAKCDCVRRSPLSTGAAHPSRDVRRSRDGDKAALPLRRTRDSRVVEHGAPVLKCVCLSLASARVQRRSLRLGVPGEGELPNARSPGKVSTCSCAWSKCVLPMPPTEASRNFEGCGWGL